MVTTVSNLPLQAVEYLEALETELGVAIEFTSSGRSHHTYTPDEGHVIFDAWSAHTPTAFSNRRHLPAAFFRRDAVDALSVWDLSESSRSYTITQLYDTMDPGSESYADEHTPGYEIGGIQYAQLQPRVVYAGIPLHLISGPQFDCLDFDVVYGDPIRLACDPNLDEQIREVRREAVRTAVRTWAEGAEERALDQIRRQITQQESYLTDYTTRLVDTRRQLATLGTQARSIEESVPRDPEHYLSIYEQLLAHPKVADVDMQGEQLIVTTTKLRITAPGGAFDGESRCLGRMRVNLDVMGSNINIENLDYPRNGRAHPHVDNTGTPCFGNIENTVYAYLERRELVALIEVLIAMFETYNPSDDWGRYARMWFSVPDPEPVTDEETA
jgi:hypothetical protein